MGLGGCVSCDDRDGRLRHLRPQRRLPADPGPVRDADLRVPPGRADRRHDRRGARRARLRGEQRLRLTPST
ncbi:MAG: hypothetical protein MZV49_12620 [Rhodopseudomonas palustris]|nr:hypothetical protein [Rhodopseudomonas palustris]